MKANRAPSSGVWKSAPSCIYLLPANLNSPSWHPGNLCYRAQVSKGSGSERLTALCSIRSGRCTSSHWSAGFGGGSFVPFPNSTSPLFSECLPHFGHMQPTPHLGVFKNTNTWKQTPRDPPETCRVISPSADPHRMRGNKREVLSCMEWGERKLWGSPQTLNK